MNEKITVLVVALILIFAMGVNLKVNAETRSLVFIPQANSTTLQEGEEVVISLKLSEINMGEEGINSFGGKLVYDEEIFEKVTVSDISSQNNWSIAYNDEETDMQGTFLATTNMGASEAQTIGTIKLRVKTNLKSTTTTIRFTELSSVAEDTVNLEDETIQLSIKGTIQENVEPENTVENIVENTIKDETIATEKIPQTWANNYIVGAIIVLIVIAVIAYIRYRKNNINA